MSIEAKPDTSKTLVIEKCVRLEGSFIVGSKSISSNNTYLSGGGLQYSYCLKSGHYLGFGFGAGAHLFKDEGFIPFYLDIIGMINKKRYSPFLICQTGYAFGWSCEYDGYYNAEFNGGIYLGIELGKRFRLNDDFSSYFSLSYRRQFASIDYEIDTLEKCHDKLGYTFLTIGLGVILEQ